MRFATLCLVLTTAVLASTAHAQTPPPEHADSPPHAAQEAPPTPPSAPDEAPPVRAHGNASVHAHGSLTRPAPQPRTVEKGGGIGRAFAWTTLLTGITGGLASAGLVVYAKVELDSCQQNSLFGLGCAEKEMQLEDATNVAILGGIAAGGLLGTSIILFVVTDPKHTVIEYGDPHRPTLPIGGYVATAVTLGGAITAHVMMSQAAAELRDPQTHPTQHETESLVSKYRYSRYAAGGLYTLSAAFGVMAALETVRVVRTQNESESPRVSVSPTASGAMFSLTGRF